MGKCQTDPSSKDYEIEICYAGGTACCPTLRCPAYFGPPAWISQNLDLFPSYFESQGLDISKKKEIHSSPLHYQGSLPCEDRSQKVVKSIKFSRLSVCNIAFRLGKLDLFHVGVRPGVAVDHFEL